MKYMINWNYLMESEEFEGTLNEAKAYADDGITYNQQNCEIREEDDETIVAVRKWFDVEYHGDDNDYCENPIEFGDYGYYSDWIDE